LLERAKAQEPAAWERLVSLYTPLIDHWCHKAGLQDADAADVRQEVFVAVARKIAEFHRDQAGDTFRGWLSKITHSKIADHWRKKRAAPRNADAGVQAQWEQAAQASDSAEAVAEETRILYRRALQLVQRDFEDHTWQAFWRVVIDGQSAKDTAGELHVTVNAVYLAKARVLARLREEFAGAIEE
jgi:RNA polymerase sigma-70 factor (ECF subfamily)